MSSVVLKARGRGWSDSFRGSSFTVQFSSASRPLSCTHTARAKANILLRMRSKLPRGCNGVLVRPPLLPSPADPCTSAANDSVQQV